MRQRSRTRTLAIFPGTPTDAKLLKMSQAWRRPGRWMLLDRVKWLRRKPSTSAFSLRSHETAGAIPTLANHHAGLHGDDRVVDANRERTIIAVRVGISFSKSGQMPLKPAESPRHSLIVGRTAWKSPDSPRRENLPDAGHVICVCN